MVLPIKPICRANMPRKEGTSIIFFNTVDSVKKRTLLNSIIAIPANYRNKKLCRISEKLPTEFGDHKLLNEELIRQKRIVEDLITYTTKKQIANKETYAFKYVQRFLQAHRSVAVIKHQQCWCRNSAIIIAASGCSWSMGRLHAIRVMHDHIVSSVQPVRYM